MLTSSSSTQSQNHSNKTVGWFHTRLSCFLPRAENLFKQHCYINEKYPCTEKSVFVILKKTILIQRCDESEYFTKIPVYSTTSHFHSFNHPRFFSSIFKSKCSPPYNQKCLPQLFKLLAGWIVCNASITTHQADRNRQCVALRPSTWDWLHEIERTASKKCLKNITYGAREERTQTRHWFSAKLKPKFL